LLPAANSMIEFPRLNMPNGLYQIFRVGLRLIDYDALQMVAELGAIRC
jgi:hypothetical protein